MWTPVTFVRKEIAPLLPEVVGKLESVIIHPTCATTRLGITDDLVAVAKLFSAEVHIPDDWGCCGFAGDRGMLLPELTASATKAEAKEVVGVRADAYLSSNRTCEIGMTRATGESYVHVLEQLSLAVSRQEAKVVGTITFFVGSSGEVIRLKRFSAACIANSSTE